MNGLSNALSIQPVQRTITCSSIGFVQVNRDLITMLARMTIELSVMDLIRTAQLVDGLPNQLIAEKVHP